MKKIRICLIFTFVVFLTSLALADKIYLKNGRVVQGKIFERGPYYVSIMEGNVPRKLFKDEIVKIEEENIIVDDKIVVDYSKFNIARTKVDLIIAFIEISGTRKAMELNFENIIEKTPQEQKLLIENLFNISGVIESLIPLYDKYYSEEDLKQLNDFYGSVVGQKLIDVTPKIMKEAIETSANYIKEKMQSAVKK